MLEAGRERGGRGDSGGYIYVMRRGRRVREKDGGCKREPGQSETERERARPVYGRQRLLMSLLLPLHSESYQYLSALQPDCVDDSLVARTPAHDDGDAARRKHPQRARAIPPLQASLRTCPQEQADTITSRVRRLPVPGHASPQSHPQSHGAHLASLPSLKLPRGLLIRPSLSPSPPPTSISPRSAFPRLVGFCGSRHHFTPPESLPTPSPWPSRPRSPPKATPNADCPRTHARFPTVLRSPPARLGRALT
ncbi:hypothetical protein BV20DRAFT_805890 [Pilatotrama ljubarskyi]|nr:hypothetical protein BV20DRAFT_805890 [Pilatotrama ljubarskyi]